MNNNFNNTAANFGNSKIHAAGQSLRLIQNIIPWNKDAVFADLACGTGNLGKAVRHHVNRVIFTDASAEMLAICKEKNVDTNADYIRADCHTLPLASESIDIAGCRFAFHHFENPPVVFEELHRVLTPQGIFFTIDLTGSYDAAMNNINHSIELLHDETHVKSFTEKELKDLAKNNNFSCVQAEVFTESEEGLTIEEWCRLTDREVNAANICRQLSVLTQQQLSELGYSKKKDNFINHVKTAITIFKKL